jgi:hypothetical protein
MNLELTRELLGAAEQQPHGKLRVTAYEAAGEVELLRRRWLHRRRLLLQPRKASGRDRTADGKRAKAAESPDDEQLTAEDRS